MNESDWCELLEQLRVQGSQVHQWIPAPPVPSAVRCVQSRHRTLAHLRAAQQTWLVAVERFIVMPGARVVLPHPWRLFDQEDFASVPWESHMAAFVADRKRWLAIVETPAVDRTVGGRLNRLPRTIESLTKSLADHERHHIDGLSDLA